ncbi:muscarinic acetylcholine receptor M2-like [Scyliorhinus canicula]|uniref:muscarinic acetylcholine receptor M2-like n=1 Tax=Scyliorhinus canicula TaxID=7830 RepID=UPI0018F7BC70|nr:muscarinic acetylcholine receptor M2-like [Scyliorhinus canicula]
MENSAEVNESLTNLTGGFDTEGGYPYTTVEVVFVVIVTGGFSVMTIIGNILVIASITLNRQLQTINNYFIFSLACADLIIGLFSMNLYTVYTVTGYWPMGTVLCDLWLAVDYVASSASGLNLLIISFDRYFCVTKPLSYPVKRTAKVAGMMIGAAWVLAFFLWVPAILFWQFIVGKRTVGDGECYVQFLSNQAVIFVTAIAAFYLPVLIMVILYVQISRASRSRVKEDIKETESNKFTVVRSLGRRKRMKQNKNIPNGTDRLAQVKKQNDKITGAMTINTCGHAADKDLPNKSTSGNMVEFNQTDGGTTQGRIINVCNDESRFRTNNSELSIITIVGKCQKIADCDGTAKIASDINGKNGNAREVTAPTVLKIRGAVSRGEKVTRTILAILLAFIITLSPYFFMVLISTMCSICVPYTAWTIGYWLVYINSTVNPACYALCNPTFKKTFKHLILCQYKSIGRA